MEMVFLLMSGPFTSTTHKTIRNIEISHVLIRNYLSIFSEIELDYAQIIWQVGEAKKLHSAAGFITDIHRKGKMHFFGNYQFFFKVHI